MNTDFELAYSQIDIMGLRDARTQLVSRKNKTLNPTLIVCRVREINGYRAIDLNGPTEMMHICIDFLEPLCGTADCVFRISGYTILDKKKVRIKGILSLWDGSFSCS